MCVSFHSRIRRTLVSGKKRDHLLGAQSGLTIYHYRSQWQSTKLWIWALAAQGTRKSPVEPMPARAFDLKTLQPLLNSPQLKFQVIKTHDLAWFQEISRWPEQLFLGIATKDIVFLLFDHWHQPAGHEPWLLWNPFLNAKCYYCSLAMTCLSRESYSPLWSLVMISYSTSVGHGL